jgi:hypothetical protein
LKRATIVSDGDLGTTWGRGVMRSETTAGENGGNLCGKNPEALETSARTTGENGGDPGAKNPEALEMATQTTSSDVRGKRYEAIVMVGLLVLSRSEKTGLAHDHHDHHDDHHDHASCSLSQSCLVPPTDDDNIATDAVDLSDVGNQELHLP